MNIAIKQLLTLTVAANIRNRFGFGKWQYAYQIYVRVESKRERKKNAHKSEMYSAK